jgi:hypothetical protein
MTAQTAPALTPSFTEVQLASLHIPTIAEIRAANRDPNGVADITADLPSEVSAALGMVGVTYDRRLVYSAFLSNARVKGAMEAAGYEWLTLDSDEEGFTISGWVKTRTDIALPRPPSPLVQLVRIKSDTPTPGRAPITYTVGVQVNDNGVWKTHGCTCEAGAQGKPCKHLYRAQSVASGAFAAARDALLAANPALTREGFDALFAERAKAAGTNGAIALVIKAGLGDAHTLARLPALPATPHTQLRRFLAKQAPAAQPATETP